MEAVVVSNACMTVIRSIAGSGEKVCDRFPKALLIPPRFTQSSSNQDHNEQVFRGGVNDHSHWKRGIAMLRIHEVANLKMPSHESVRPHQKGDPVGSPAASRHVGYQPKVPKGAFGYAA